MSVSLLKDETLYCGSGVCMSGFGSPIIIIESFEG